MQRNIRIGHQKTVDNVLAWLQEQGNLEQRSFCEAGFELVICLDVFIHYPQAPAEEMVRHLAAMAEQHLIVSFAPYTPLLALLNGIGQLFHGPSKTTRAYTLRENAGFVLRRRSLNKAPFYFSRLLAFERT